MGLLPSEYITGSRPGVDGFGRANVAVRDTQAETVAQMRERLNADTPENNQRKAIAASAMAQIERAFGGRG